MKPGAFVDMKKVKQYTEADYGLPENPPFSWLLRKPRDENQENDQADDNKTTNAAPGTPTKDDKENFLIGNNNNSNTKNSGSDDSGKKVLTTQQSTTADANTGSTHSSDSDGKSVSQWKRDDELLLKELVS